MSSAGPLGSLKFSHDHMIRKLKVDPVSKIDNRDYDSHAGAGYGHEGFQHGGYKGR